MGGQDSESFAIQFLLSLRKVSREVRTLWREQAAAGGARIAPAKTFRKWGAGWGPDSELSFDFGVGVDRKLEFVGTLVAVQRESELRRVDVGNCPRNGRAFRGVAEWSDFRRNRNRPHGERETHQEK